MASVSMSAAASAAAYPVTELRGNANILAHARKQGFLHQPGEVTKEQVEKITKLISEIVMNPSNQQTALANFQMMLSDDAGMQIRKAAVDTASAAMGKPMRALMNATAGFFKGDLQIKLKSMFEMMAKMFPAKATSLNPMLEIGVKMAVMPKMDDLLASVEKISRAYIGNLIARENASAEASATVAAPVKK